MGVNLVRSSPKSTPPSPQGVLSDWEKVEAVYEKLRENSELVKRIRKASSYRELLVAGRIVICVFEGRDIEVEVRLDG